jgi:hypothetical protein
MNLKNIQLPYLLAGLGVVGLGAYLLLRKTSSGSGSDSGSGSGMQTRALDLRGSTGQAPNLFAPSAGQTYQRTTNASTGGSEAPSGASTGPSTKNLVLLSDPAHKFTVAEVQALLNLFGTSPRPAINGQWSDETTLAVRDYQTRTFKQDPWFNITDVTGNPFEAKTSGTLRQFALKLLLDPRHVFSIEEAQALLGVPMTGVEDAATVAKLKFSGQSPPISSAANQAWLRNVATGVTAWQG